MIITLDQIEKYLGHKIKDPYGRVVGTLVSVYSDIDGVVTNVEVAFSDSDFRTVPAKRIQLTPEGVVIIPEWKAEAIEVEQKLDRARKRYRALEELYRKGQIPVHAYDELKNKLDAQLKRLKTKVKEVRSVLKKRINELEDMVLHIEKAMTHLIVSYTAAEIGEHAFKTSIDILRQARSRAIDEKKDIERHLELIEKLEGEPVELFKKEAKAPKIPQTGIAQPPEAPLVVEVVNA